MRGVIFTNGSAKLVRDESCLDRPYGILPMACRRFFTSVIIGLMFVSGFAARAAAEGIAALQREIIHVEALQQLHAARALAAR